MGTSFRSSNDSNSYLQADAFRRYDGLYLAPQCSQESPLDIEHQAAENRILGPGGTHWQSLVAWAHASPILSGQPPLLAFFPPVVCEPVMLSCALRRMASERAWSVTTRETVSAPIRVKAATIASTASTPCRAPSSCSVAWLAAPTAFARFAA